MNLTKECILQYLVGVDTVISQNGLDIDREFLIAVSNNAIKIGSNLEYFIEEIKSQNLTSPIREDFQRYYTQFDVDGSFALLDEKNNRLTFFNPIKYNERISPASTFKICNALIGLETQSVHDKTTFFEWDSTIYQNENWNKSQDLQTAFKNSTVWYYQKMARLIGGQEMKCWLDKLSYGNMDTSGGIDQFWLTGGLKISPKEEIEFLQKLNNLQLPFQQKNMLDVKQMMLIEQTEKYAIYGKTGWGMNSNKDLGWFVGFIETNNNVYYFSNCIESNKDSSPNFAIARKEITYRILKELNIF
jgi:beta-lactamase class D